MSFYTNLKQRELKVDKWLVKLILLEEVLAKFSGKKCEGRW